MTLIQRINLLTDFVGKQLKTLFGNVGTLTDLTTDDKTSLVGAVNELKTGLDNANTGGSGAAIDDSAPSASSAYSSAKTNALIQQLKNELLGGAGEAYDTLKELEDALKNDQSTAAALAQAVALRLRIDEAQTLSSEQKAAVEQSLNLGDTDTDFVARLEAALS
ncbi:hypothetical protein J2T38_001677 [Neisseria perflava]|uniref:hypothetical protein n=1 Tax=Neisseria perflava TaxID=33053 RepID=UPI0020A1585C|nr:hypothetical protein [Neisseria perflava]MCP1772841.1 hypothetical protein [Neisseria perflava]